MVSYGGLLQVTDSSKPARPFLDGKITSHSSPEAVRDFYETDGANWSDNYARPVGEDYPTNPALLRLNLVCKLVERYGCDNMLDAGCADGPVMLEMLRRGKTIRGFDFSPTLVAKGKARLRQGDFSEGLCEIGDVTRIDLPDASFDSVLCLGVLPHIERLDLAVTELVRVARPGATLILSFRNDLFDLFTFNRLTVEFFAENFLAEVPCTAEERERARGLLDGMVTHPNLPEQHYTDGGIPSFGSVTRINHNPLTIADQLRPFGLRHELNGYYKFHPFPPLLEQHFPHFRQWGARMDEALSFAWQGMFMCSTFVAVFKKD